ncbi:UDP-N-acetylmuramoyl-L-alanyl-D-glutamate--2,6-diaminopimelate ligase [Granulicella cerasi]|uniref:UDP-N-acetylmuramoyl-L-alanyl-D-glutamate--2,6-diaminopimelate ligase n=1 Tax=Granulicella cerasi TaxID=741063 RepID=A0ABW1ZD90_9BACT
MGDPAVDVRGVQYDSRRVEAGDVFVAMRGGSTDGNRFVTKALELGASAIITDSSDTAADVKSRGIPVALVEHGRRALAEASAALFGHPERLLKVSAVTGTNGKTTTAFLLAQMLESVGRKVLLLGTVETRIAGRVLESEHTTPEARDLYALFAQALDAGCTEVVMEMSSHALEQERVWGVPVDVAIFTNLTQDHLDYHGTMEEYARAKAKLFHGVGGGAPRIAVINDDAAFAGLMIDSYEGEEFVIRYGTTESANHRASDVQLHAGHTSFMLTTPAATVLVESPLTGQVNVENLTAAMCAAMARGLSLDEVLLAARQLKAAPGRFEVVPGSAEAGFAVVVDYAHTDDALANLVRLARELVQPQGGRVITMFGCGGNRDRTKRPKMGRVAALGSDIVVLTSDNPRSEDPQSIIDEVMVGVRDGVDASHAEVIADADRHAAIVKAIHAAKPGDIVLLAGKGHEKTQTFADRTVAFDDVAEAARVLKEIQ